MVYYGVLSRGCQRCRKRKIKCDEQKPGCLRCHRSDVPCPGYRDLDHVRFRDDTRRTILRAGNRETQAPGRIHVSRMNSQDILSPRPSVSDSGNAIRRAIPRAIPVRHHELSASFYFSKYAFHEVPLSEAYQSWLTESYRDAPVLKAAIEAVGMAGMSNVLYAPHLEVQARKRYSEALASTQQALNDADHAADDTTLMAVILLGLFETLNFRNGDQYRSWETHIKGALTLLELRGQEQFSRERGGQLYTQIRSQILSVYMQQNSGVPRALAQAARSFQTSSTRQRWRKSNIATPSSIFEISFRIVNLRAAMLRGDAGLDRKAARETAMDIDRELQAWSAALPQEWNYQIEILDGPLDGGFGGIRHVYPSLWNAEVWNNWRLVRVLVSRILLDTSTESHGEPSLEPSVASIVSRIRQYSEDICVSTNALIDTPRILSLIRPLCVVALEEPNLASVRFVAVDRLRRIGSSMGVRQAVLLADTVARSLSEPQPHNSARPSSCWDVPMMPFC
ncbi:fungal specific transcription factor domain-containing protein [Purpureocillium lilacinum]|uniref:Fungal specific transcription factor domain-containing protein n=1 Tax=Purpureocillium lilacinum TaxID=33203 RepID=A0A179HIP8_PURLI|nr:fungal specific transcription factor domain-containing protein [Purpureocillium lilacinum]OAQ89772.1 fungal specific transcription factor domain-containing protein [Purpureocillium lilacinum]